MYEYVFNIIIMILMLIIMIIIMIKMWELYNKMEFSVTNRKIAKTCLNDFHYVSTLVLFSHSFSYFS